jgi:hypothetical protein
MPMNPTPARTKAGQVGSTPVVEAIATSTPIQSDRAIPATAAAPPVVQTAPSRCTSREKRAIRSTPPIRVGRTALASDPIPYRATASTGPHETPHARSTARHARALPAIDAAISTPVTASHRASASAIPTRPSRSPFRSPAASASSGRSRISAKSPTIGSISAATCRIRMCDRKKTFPL